MSCTSRSSWATRNSFNPTTYVNCRSTLLPLIHTSELQPSDTVTDLDTFLGVFSHFQLLSSIHQVEHLASINFKAAAKQASTMLRA